jgi:hypothetical protein
MLTIKELRHCSSTPPKSANGGLTQMRAAGLLLTSARLLTAFLIK